MSKRDYAVLAHAFHASDDQAITSGEQMGVAIARQNVTSALRSNNIRFDEKKFLAVARGEAPCKVCEMKL